MAKKTKSTEEFEGGIGSLMSLVSSVDDSAEIIADSAYSNIQEWISTGNYILNACMSGDIYKAVPTGRIVTFSGTSGAGKSFLACSCCREAQKLGYIPIYLDSEGAIDSDFVRRLGVDPTKLIIKKVNTIMETSQFIANLCNKLQEQQDKYGQHDKVIIVLDSLGNLTSEKEREDTLSGSQKADFTKAKDTKAMFRVCATPIAKLQIPWIVVNHVYQSMSFIPQNIQAMGCLRPDEKIITNNGIKQMKDIVVGDKVLSHDNEYHDVEKVWHFKKPTYTFTFDNGETITCSNTHRFLINPDKPELDSSWKVVSELNENDEIYAISE